MVYIKYLPKICHFQKHSFPFTSSFYGLKSLVIMFSKCFWVLFIHYNDFKISEYIYTNTLKITLCNIHLKFFILFLNLKNIKPNTKFTFVVVHVSVTKPTYFTKLHIINGRFLKLFIFKTIY